MAKIIIPLMAIYTVSKGPRPYSKAPVRMQRAEITVNFLDRISIIQKITIPAKDVLKFKIAKACSDAVLK